MIPGSHIMDWMASPAPLAQGDDFSEWANILIIAVIAVFSAIGGLIKSAEAKKRQRRPGGGVPQRPAGGQPRESWQQRLARKAEEVQRAIQTEYEKSQQRHAPPAARQRPAERGRLTARTGRSGESIMVFEKEEGRESVAERQAQHERRAREAVAAARRTDVAATMEAPPQPAGSAAGPTIINYDDPEALRKAILHYEILGRPVAMRDPFERTAEY